MKDSVNHPTHYTSHPSGVECITITEHMGFNLGNAVKYIWRAGLKGDEIEDLKKAVWYVQREISRREKEVKQPTETVTQGKLSPEVPPIEDRQELTLIDVYEGTKSIGYLPHGVLAFAGVYEARQTGDVVTVSVGEYAVRFRSKYVARGVDCRCVVYYAPSGFYLLPA